MRLILANPRGFCAGVDRAIDIVEKALALFGAPIYVRHEVVHNRFIVDDLKEKGVVFIEMLADVPDNGTVIFSAHGVSKDIRKASKDRGLRVFDATCPLVTKVHLEVARYEQQGMECILIGHKNHPEVEGTMGQYTAKTGGMYLVETPEDVAKLEINNSDEVAFVTQTTLSVDDAAIIVDALKKRFPKIKGPSKDDICYATQNRQDAVKQLAAQCDLILVVGSKTSSNSNRLSDIANQLHVEAYLIDSAADINQRWLIGKKNVGLTAGASAPEVLVEEVVAHLKKLGVEQIDQQQGRLEKVVFSLPKELKMA